MLKRHQKIVAAISVAALAAGLGACGSDSNSSSDTDTIRFGLLNSMTGGYGAVGKQELASIELAIDEINAAGGVDGRDLEVVVVDDQGTISEATAGFKKLAIDEELPVILGPGITATSEAVAPLSDQYEVVLVNFAQQPEIVEERAMAFQLLGPQRSVAEAMVKYAADENFTEAGLLHINDPFGTNGSTYINEAAGEAGLDIVLTDSWNADGFDFSAQVSKVMKENPELLFLYGSGGTSNGQVLKQIRDAGYKGTILGDITFASGELSKVAKDAADTIISFSQIDYANADEKTTGYLDGFMDKVGAPPASFAATGYDAVYLLAEAIEHADGEYDAASVTEALESDDFEFSGVLGTQEYSAEHHAGPGASVFVPMQLNKGEFTAPRS